MGNHDRPVHGEMTTVGGTMIGLLKRSATVEGQASANLCFMQGDAVFDALLTVGEAHALIAILEAFIKDAGGEIGDPEWDERLRRQEALFERMERLAERLGIHPQEGAAPDATD